MLKAPLNRIPKRYLEWRTALRCGDLNRSVSAFVPLIFCKFSAVFPQLWKTNVENANDICHFSTKPWNRQRHPQFLNTNAENANDTCNFGKQTLKTPMTSVILAQKHWKRQWHLQFWSTTNTENTKHIRNFKSHTLKTPMTSAILEYKRWKR
jgi:hypothetical protein